MVSGKIGVILLVIAVVVFLTQGGADITKKAIKEARGLRDEALNVKDENGRGRMGGQSS